MCQLRLSMRQVGTPAQPGRWQDAFRPHLAGAAAGVGAAGIVAANAGPLDALATCKRKAARAQRLVREPGGAGELVPAPPAQHGGPGPAVGGPTWADVAAVATVEGVGLDADAGVSAKLGPPGRAGAAGIDAGKGLLALLVACAAVLRVLLEVHALQGGNGGCRLKTRWGGNEGKRLRGMHKGRAERHISGALRTFLPHFSWVWGLQAASMSRPLQQGGQGSSQVRCVRQLLGGTLLPRAAPAGGLNPTTRPTRPWGEQLSGDECIGAGWEGRSSLLYSQVGLGTNCQAEQDGDSHREGLHHGLQGASGRHQEVCGSPHSAQRRLVGWFGAASGSCGEGQGGCGAAAFGICSAAECLNRHA